MRTLSSIFTLALFLSAAAAVACSGEAGSEESIGTNQAALDNGNSATGDSCTIDLDSGLKEPGTDDGKGHCCSVFDSTKCVDKATLVLGTFGDAGRTVRFPRGLVDSTNLKVMQ